MNTNTEYDYAVGTSLDNLLVLTDGYEKAARALSELRYEFGLDFHIFRKPRIQWEAC